MIFRWSIWGDHIYKNKELLRYSTALFKKQFGDEHQYIVYTDNREFVSGYLEDKNVDIRLFPTGSNSPFYISSKATWKKWCPSSRLDINQTEFYIDSDVFLLKYPEEVDIFLSDKNQRFAILDEYLGRSWQHGAMSKRASVDTPFVNAGFFVQKAGHDISDDLKREFEWWKSNVEESKQTHHDEQGALAIALMPYLKRGELSILPKSKYMLIGLNENKDVDKLKDTTLFHAVYPDHPAFYKFKKHLDTLLNKERS